MWKFVVCGIGTGALLAMLGVSLTDVAEYVTVAKNRTGALVSDAVPVSVRIDRMEVIRDKIQDRVQEQAMVVAKAKLAADEATADLRQSEMQQVRLLSEMRQLREGTRCSTPGEPVPVSENMLHALSGRLAAYRSVESLNAAKSKAVDAQRRAYEQLAAQFAEWQNKRQLLSYQIETLRARYTAQQLGDTASTDIFSDADLARATQLAAEVEKIISLNEVQRSLLTSPQEIVTHDLTPPSPDDAALLLQDVDAVLGTSVTER